MKFPTTTLRARLFFAAAFWLAAGAACVQASAIVVEAEVDARELPRKLLHTRMEIPAGPGTLALWYPKWVPGIHGPGGPIQNVAGLRVETRDGTPIPWLRDAEERYRILCELPDGAESVIVSLDYICNQPSVNSRGVDSYGNSLVGVINWNTCLLYPEGFSNEDIEVRLSLRLPPDWKHASALPSKSSRKDRISFEPASLRRVIDSPLVAGRHLRSVALETEGINPVLLHLVSESPSALLIGDELEQRYGAMASEAGALFGAAHFDEYHLLVTCTDDFPYTGLEHLESSYNSVHERDLLSEKKIQGWVGYLLPHEFAHSWCGKYRRPVGMATADYHTPKRTSLLWVYEGLDQYLGEILAMRSGLWQMDSYKEAFAQKISTLVHQRGRAWRPLEDTAADSYHLRGGSPAWSNMRRNQDYYNEGLLIWMEADAIIREQTDGRRSLDDFCRAFMGPGLVDTPVHPFTEQEVFALLNGIAPYDWEPFFRERVAQPLDALPLDFVARLGYRIEYDEEASAYLQDIEADRSYLWALDSIGATFSNDGEVGGSLVPGMPAEKAGLAPGMTVIGVDGRKYSNDRLKDAIAESASSGRIELLVLDGDEFRTIKMKYQGGLKYLTLVRDETRPDMLAQIFAPLRPRAGDE